MTFALFVQGYPKSPWPPPYHAAVRRTFTGEILAKDIEGGVTALSSVSPSSDLSLKTAKQRVPLTQLPYYKVLIKGEKMVPKKGRADDFSWPRAPLSSDHE